MPQVATSPFGGAAMSKLMKVFATLALVFGLVAFAPVGAEAQWGGGWRGGGWGGGWRGGGWGGGWRGAGWGGGWRRGGCGSGPARGGVLAPAGVWCAGPGAEW